MSLNRYRWSLIYKDICIDWLIVDIIICLRHILEVFWNQHVVTSYSEYFQAWGFCHFHKIVFTEEGGYNCWMQHKIVEQHIEPLKMYESFDGNGLLLLTDKWMKYKYLLLTYWLYNLLGLFKVVSSTVAKSDLMSP